ncbi:MAG TPA: DUF4252 domain-containing protein [Bryobacteraceae bacterium]|nr:DUF4252 domain-containing protein [Bryobacteraceae bacterium]
MKFTILLSLLTAAGAFAQAQAPFRLNLDRLAAKAAEAVDVTLDSSTLQLAGKFMSGQKDEAQVKKLISGLKGIMVRSFEFSSEGQYTPADLEPVRNQLQGPGWARFVNVQSKADRENTEIYSKTENGQITGLAIITTEPKELTIVYIDGPIDLAQLSNLGGHFGIPPVAVPDAQKKGSK